MFLSTIPKRRRNVKRVLVLAVAVCFILGVAGGAFAESLKDNVGCGLGSMIFENTKDSIAIEVLAATTNGILGNQTFGITTGTLGCRTPAKWVSNEMLNKFVASNMDGLAKDIAMGKGENLDTLAELMGVSPEKRPEFNATLQTNFSNIFTSEKVESADVIDNIVAVSHLG